MITISRKDYYLLLASFYYAKHLFNDKDVCICASTSNTPEFSNLPKICSPRDAMIRVFGSDEIKNKLEEKIKKELGTHNCLSLENAFRLIEEMIKNGEIVINN